MAHKCTYKGCGKVFPGANSYANAVHHYENTHNYAGRIQVSKARSTGTMVGVYHSEEAGLESDPNGKYSTVCETHHNMVTHRSLTLAKSFASAPEQFCPDCRGDEVPEWLR